MSSIKHTLLAGEVDLAWLCAAINAAQASRWDMRGQDAPHRVRHQHWCVFHELLKPNSSNGESCAIQNIASKPLKELGRDVRTDGASSSLSHKKPTPPPPLCSARNELMMRGDDRGGGAHFKFHADQRATSPVSHNQHDFAGRNKQTLTELFFFPRPGGPRARRGLIPVCHFYLLNCRLQTTRAHCSSLLGQCVKGTRG